MKDSGRSSWTRWNELGKNESHDEHPNSLRCYLDGGAADRLYRFPAQRQHAQPRVAEHGPGAAH